MTVHGIHYFRLHSFFLETRVGTHMPTAPVPTLGVHGPFHTVLAAKPDISGVSLDLVRFEQQV